MSMHNIALDDRAWELMQHAIATRKFEDESEAVCAGFEALERERMAEEARTAYINMRVARSKEQIANGQFVRLSSDEDIDAFMDRMEQRLVSDAD